MYFLFFTVLTVFVCVVAVPGPSACSLKVTGSEATGGGGGGGDPSVKETVSGGGDVLFSRSVFLCVDTAPGTVVSSFTVGMTERHVKIPGEPSGTACVYVVPVTTRCFDLSFFDTIPPSVSEFDSDDGRFFPSGMKNVEIP